MMAAVNMKIESASAPRPNDNTRQTESPLDSNAIGMVIAAETMTETEDAGFADGKTGLTDELRNGQLEGDMQVVNREGKGSLLILPDKIGQGSMGE
jgi:hypothetical protein